MPPRTLFRMIILPESHVSKSHKKETQTVEPHVKECVKYKKVHKSAVSKITTTCTGNDAQK